MTPGATVKIRQEAKLVGFIVTDQSFMKFCAARCPLGAAVVTVITAELYLKILWPRFTGSAQLSDTLPTVYSQLSAG